jgi:hypothetical protein
MKNINFIALNRSLKKIFEIVQKHHVIIIFVIVFSTLIAIVANVNAILSQPPDENYRLQAEQRSIHTNFDQETIKSIHKLRERQENATLTLPPGRNNPFAE